jgi:hypothetical protein
MSALYTYLSVVVEVTSVAQQQMFGVDDLDTRQIYEAHINELTLRNNTFQEHIPQWAFIMSAKASARLIASTFDNMVDSMESMVCQQPMDFSFLDTLNLKGEIVYSSSDHAHFNATGDFFGQALQHNENDTFHGMRHFSDHLGICSEGTAYDPGSSSL